MATNGMTINGLNPLSALTADDKIPVWDTGASGEPTKEITAQNMANSVKPLASLPNTTEMNNAIAQSTAIPKVAPTRIMGNGSTLYQTTPTAIDGYVPICICGYTSIGSYHVTDDLYDFYYDTNSGKILMNFASAKTSDVGLNVYMLYVKSQIE